MKNTLFTVVFTILLQTACQLKLEKAAPLQYITSLKNELPSRLRQGCTFRYNLENLFGRLDNQTQEKALQESFSLWQKANPNLRFLRYLGNNPEIIVRFVPHSETAFVAVSTPQGLIRGQVQPISAVRREKNTHVILLDQDVNWTYQILKQVLAHHIGLFLGLNTSSESGSLMNPLLIGQEIQLSKKEEDLVQKLYPDICKDLLCDPLPVYFELSKETSQKYLLTHQGTLSVKAKGGIVVGIWLGTSGPDGITRGLFNFPIDDYNIVPELEHAVLMYRLSGQTRWTRCGSSCEIPTDGVSECMEITFHINDRDITDNTGAYNVTVDYKK